MVMISKVYTDFYRLSNEELIEIAKNPDNSLRDRSSAIPFIKCNHLLKDIARNTSNRSLLKTIFEFMPDETDFFVDFSKKHHDWQIRLMSIKFILNDYFFNRDFDSILSSREYEEYISRQDLIDIALSDEDYKNRLVAALFIDDDSVLMDLALNDANNHVRIAAISGIDDEAKLTEVITENKDFNVIKFASAKIRDDSKLIEIYNSKRTPGHERGLVSNIHDQSFLTDVVYKNSFDWTLCEIAVSNIYSQKTLHEIVKHYAHPDFREPDRELYFPDDYTYLAEFLHYTIRLIFDDELLKDLAFSHEDFCLYYDVIDSIENPSLLTDIVMKYPITMCWHDFVQITDEDKLFEIALNHPVEETRKYAVSHIFDKDKLRKIIDSETNEEVKNDALYNLEFGDDDFTLDTENINVFVNVLKTIDDDSKLLDIFLQYKNPIIKQVACETIADESILKDIAMNNYIFPAGIAINNISNDEFILDIALNACFEKTRVYAISKISDNDMLKRIFEDSTSYCCQINALSRITDEEYLAGVATNHPDEYLRRIARVK